MSESLDWNWEEWMQRLVAGDEEAVEAFWQGYGGRLRRLADKQVKIGLQRRFDADDAERWELRLLAQDEDFTAAIAVAGKIADIKAFHCLPLVEMSELGQLAELLPAAKS